MSSPDPNSDAQLARRAAGGDRAALGELLSRHWRLLAGYLRECCKVPPSDVDDCLQDTMLRAVRHAAKWDGNVAWLRALAKSAAEDWRRKKRANPGGDVVDLIAAPPVAVAEPHPKLAGCLEKLRDEYPEWHAAVVGVYYDAADQAELAEKMSLKPETFRSRLSKARAELRKCVEKP